MRVVNQQVPTPFRDIDVGTVLRPNLVEFARTGARLPLRRRKIARQLARSSARSRPMDVVLGLAEALPSGLYSGSGIEQLRARPSSTDPDRSDDFRDARRPSCTWRPPTSTRASGSSSAPTAGTTCRSRPPCAPRRRCRWSTSPSRVSDRELIDGGIVSTTNVDIAVEAGAKFVDRRQPARALRQRLLETVRRSSARARGTSATWASRRSATRPSSCWPTSACTRWPASGSTATPASTSS